MDKKLVNMLLTLLVVLAIFALAVFLVGNVFGVSSFQTDKATVLLRFGFVVLGALIDPCLEHADVRCRRGRVGLGRRHGALK